MEITVGQIAEMLRAEVDGDSSIPITGPAKIEEGQPGNLTFLANPKYEHYVYKTNASAVLVDKDFEPAQPLSVTLIRVENVYASVGQLLKWYESNSVNGHAIMTEENTGNAIHPTAKLASDVKIGPHCIVSARAEIGEGSELIGQVFIGHDVKIGKRCRIMAGVRIKHGTIIGDDCVFYENSVIGSDGFGYSHSENGYEKIPQLGIVRIGNKVEVGAGTTIDRAVMGETLIKDGVILDNMVHIGHNVIIGESTAIAAQTGIAGSTKIGKNCVIGGQTGIAGHLNVADRTMIQAKSGLSKSIKESGQKLFGYPAIEYGQYLKAYAQFRNLPDLAKQIFSLQKQLDELSKKEDPQ